MSGKKKHILRGAIAGAAGGLLASWVMNEFMTGPGQKLSQAIQSEEQNRLDRQTRNEPEEDATMKAADAIVSTLTGGEHLTWEGKQRSGPAVHYVFGASVGAIYGALAEYWPALRASFGTTFGSALFVGADVIAVPILDFGPSATEEPPVKLISPFAAHLVYGATTELVRRTIRKLL